MKHSEVALFVAQIRERGESDYIPAALVRQVVRELRDRSVVISNVEGFILTTDRDQQQNDLLYRYDKRLHQAHQPDVHLASAAAHSALHFLETALQSDRELHFKIFA